VLGAKDDTMRGKGTDTVSKELKLDMYVRDADAIIAGDHYTSSFSTGATVSNKNIQKIEVVKDSKAKGSRYTLLAGGSLINCSTSNTFKFENVTTTITVNEDVSTHLLTAGNVIGGSSTVTEKNAITVNLSSGTHKYVAAAGYLQSNTCKLENSEKITVNVSGGTYDYIYGGAAGYEAGYTANATLKGDISITVDVSGSNRV